MPVCCLFSTLSVALEYDREIIGLITFALLQLQLDLILIKETESQLPCTPGEIETKEKSRDNEKEECEKGKIWDSQMTNV